MRAHVGCADGDLRREGGPYPPAGRRALHRAYALAIALSMLLRGCARLPDAAAIPLQATGRDYDVYAALLDTVLSAGPGAPAPTPYVIVDSTFRVVGAHELDDDRVRRELGPLLHPLALAARPGLLAAGAVSVPLDGRAFRVRTRVELVSRAVLDSLPGEPGRIWPAFRARFPGANGYLALSRPGFDPAGSHALVHYARPCGDECGDSGYVLLAREGGRWRVLKRVITIIS